jgi:hypothetical protein
MTNRFASTLNDLGREIITRASSLEIKMQRINGKLHANYKLVGCVGSDPFEDDDEDEGDLLAKRKQNDAKDMEFIVNLLSRFEMEH